MELLTDMAGKYLGEVYRDRILLNNLQAIIRRRNLPFVPSLYRLLGMNEQDGLQNFADIVLESKREFEEYNTLVIDVILNNITNNHYIFIDNFFDWVDQLIPPSDVLIKPRSIIHMTNVLNMMPSVRASNQWKYDYVTGDLYCMWSNCRLKYYADYPYRCTLTPDFSSFTEDSAIYCIADQDQFYDICSLNVLKRIREYSGIVSLAGFSSPLQLETTIQRLEDEVQNDRSRSDAIYAKYRNK